MDYNDIDYNILLKDVLDIGEYMLVGGAEVSRVEDSITRMCKSYGCKSVDVYIITCNMQATIETPKGKMLSQNRRIKKSAANFDRIDYLNDLSRYICAKKPDLETLETKFQEILARPNPKPWFNYLAGILTAAGFAVFFGGNFKDFIAAGIMGAVMILAEKTILKNENNQIVFNFVVSVVGGIIAILLVKLGIGQHQDFIMIGGIMIVIPGMAMTNSIRDMLIGDVASGVLRLISTLLIAVSIAAGFAFSIIVLGGLI